MDDEQNLPIENNDSNSSLAPAADASVHMEVVLFASSQNAWGNVRVPVPQEHAENRAGPAVPIPPSSAAADEQSLREELLANDSLGG